MCPLLVFILSLFKGDKEPLKGHVLQLLSLEEPDEKHALDTSKTVLMRPMYWKQYNKRNSHSY